MSAPCSCPCKIIQIRRDKGEEKKKAALQTDLSTSLLPANNITGINQRVIVWILTDFSAWSDLVAHKWVRHTWFNHCKSIQSQPQGSPRTKGQWNEILCRGGKKKSNKIATDMPPGIRWHQLQSRKPSVMVGTVPIAVRLCHWCHRGGLRASLVVIACVCLEFKQQGSREWCSFRKKEKKKGLEILHRFPPWCSQFAS